MSAARSVALALCALWLGLVPCGCSYFHNQLAPAQLDQGYTIILPGIEGPSRFNSNLAQGLVDGGVNTAVEVHDWTTGNVLLWPIHLRHLARNRREAQKIADRIVAYQEAYPGRPVTIIGHSGGGGMALLALEALPEDHPVTNVVLMAPAISPKYDIASAVGKTTRGIYNYSSVLDAPLLIAGTTIAGTIDGRHSPSAGAFGFSRAEPCPGLFEVPWEPAMMADWHYGGHRSALNTRFVSRHIAPIIREGQIAASGGGADVPASETVRLPDEQRVGGRVLPTSGRR